MFKRKMVGTIAGAMLVLIGVSVASAQATRTWVSGVGDDANPCSRTAPCKTFAGAISKTAAGGEIDCLDPGGFGAVTITKAITIDGGPNAGGILTAGSNGIVINAGVTDVVTIRNVTIQGIGAGLNGISCLQVGTLNVENCVIANNTQKGISITASNPMKLFVSDTIIRGNTNGANGGGIFLKPGGGGSVTASLLRAQLIGNTFGIRSEDNTIVTATETQFDSNSTHGVVAVNATAVTNLNRCTSSTNTSSGLRATVGATIRFSDCMINNNSIGLESIGGNLLSFQNNHLAGNATPGAPTGVITPQ